MSEFLVLQDIWKSFGTQTVLRGLSFDVAAQEIIALLGPSGCGKSTLLRIITGLEQPDQGQLYLQGQPLQPIPVHERGFGLMFQDWALFPHRSVAQNIAFGLRMQQQSRTAINQRVAAMLQLVNLQGYAERSIFELSGGERQRVALARALAPNPRLLLLDEPLGSLDRTLREHLTTELRSSIRQTNVAAIYVTHDQAEAFTVADRVIVINNGQIAQVGSPLKLYQHPATLFVARFLGLNNIFRCDRIDQTATFAVAHTPIGTFKVDDRMPLSQQASLLIRPEATYQGLHNHVSGTIEQIVFRGSSFRIILRLNEAATLELDLPPSLRLAQGEVLSLALNPQALSFVPDS